MSMEYIRNYYSVPAKRGGRVRFKDGEGKYFTGTIKSAISSSLRVKIDGVHTKRGFWILHPTWNIEYLIPNDKD